MEALKNAAALGQTLFQMVETRIELFGVEYRMEKIRLAALMGISCLAAASLVLAGVTAIVAIVLATPEAYRGMVLMAVCGFFILMLVVCIAAAYYLMDNKHTPFAESRSELRKDAACLSSLLSEKKSPV